MAVTYNNKTRRTARWERKQKHSAQEQRLRTVLKERKRQRKVDKGVQQILRHAPNKRSGKKYTCAAAQLWEAARRLKLARSEHLSRPGYVGRDNPYLFAMSRMADRCDSWVRDPSAFVPCTQNTERQFTELVRHLFARYDAPRFFEQAWFERHERKGRRQQTWYIQLAQGESPRRLSGLPIELTKRAAHLLDRVPQELTVEQGLRWAQCRAMDAPPALADALLASPIGTDFARDAFWLTVVRFLIDQPMLDPNQVGPIVDYIHHQRHEPQLDEVGFGDPAYGQPPQPNFTMRGRTIARLLRDVDRWHGGLAHHATGQRYQRWEPSGIRGLQWTEGVGNSRKQLVVRELLDSAALVNEGSRMHHCVGTYTPSCAAGRSAIFTMTCLTRGSVQTLMTIEVSPPSRTIVQARGKCNAQPTPDEVRMLRIWAQRAELHLAGWL